MLLWAGDLNASTLVGNILFTLYLIVGTVLEERKHVLEFGENYRRYQKRVSMLVPFKYLTSKCGNSSVNGLNFGLIIA
jgi:protein-S-isoprenylcysteine O-methyltransferase Ste14